MKTCLNCKWAQWEMTKHNPPRINPRLPGFCKYSAKLDELKNHLPAVWFINGGLEKLRPFVINKTTIWCDEVFDNCNVWEEN